MTVATSPINKHLAKPSRHQAGFAFSVLLTINVLNYADRYVLSAVAPELQKDLGLSNTNLGLLASSFLLIYALTTLPLGIWADRSKRKNIIALCVAIWSIATTLVGFTRNFFQLLSFRSVLGIGEAGYAPAALSMLGDYFPKEHRGRVLSLWSIGNLIGSAIGLTVGGLIAQAYGWRWAFYVVGIPGLIMAFLIWQAHEPVRGAFDAEVEADQQDTTPNAMAHSSLGEDLLRSARHIFRIPTYWILLGAFIFSFFTIGSASFWLPKYFVDAFHISVGQAGTISGGTLAGASLVGTLLGGWIADYLQRRFPQGRLIVATFALLAGAPLILLALFMHELVPFIGVFGIATVCLSLCLGPLNAVIQDVITPELRATATGLILLLAHLFGDAASPFIVGILADNYKSLGFALTITAPTCLLLAGITCLVGLRTVAHDMKRMHEHFSTHPLRKYE